MKERLRSNLKKMIFIGWGVALAVGGLNTVASAAGEQGKNPYPFGKSTYWAWQNRPDLPASLGEAKDWNDRARSAGWPVTEYPRRGDIAVFEPGVQGADGITGRVAVVEQVMEDGNYLASQMDDSDCLAGATNCGRINKRAYTVMPGSSFIHYATDTRTTWGFASGQSGWTSKDLGTGNSGGPGWFYPVAGADPQLVSPELDLSLDFSYNAVEVDMATGMPVADPTVKVYFTTQASPTFSDDKSVTVKGTASGELMRYQFYFGSNPAWKGHLTHLRLDPAGPGTTGGVRVDRVRLVQIEAPTQQYTTLSEGSNEHGGRRR
ncbi:MAG: CHAP domain-containing protein [Chloroflexota bacterium]